MAAVAWLIGGVVLVPFLEGLLGEDSSDETTVLIAEIHAQWRAASGW